MNVQLLCVATNSQQENSTCSITLALYVSTYTYVSVNSGSLQTVVVQQGFEVLPGRRRHRGVIARVQDVDANTRELVRNTVADRLVLVSRTLARLPVVRLGHIRHRTRRSLVGLGERVLAGEHDAAHDENADADGRDRDENATRRSLFRPPSDAQRPKQLGTAVAR